MEKSEPVRILYMEDDLVLARRVQKRLQRAGYHTDIASDGETGLEMYQDGNYDVIAVGQNMPGQSGLEVIRILASRGPLPQIVMITSQSNELIAVEAMKLGAGDYVVKDVDGKYFETLPGIIERLLERQRLIEDKKQAEEALRTSMEIQNAILSTTDVLLAYMDLEFNFIAVNQAYADAGRRRQEDFVGKNHFDLYPHKENEEIFRKTVETGEAQFFSAKPFEHPDQPERGTTWWDWSLIPSKDEFGNMCGLVFSVLDVTERMRAEEGQRKAMTEALQTKRALQTAHDELEARVEERTAELAKTNEAQRESEEKYRSLIGNIPGAAYRYRCDEHYTIEFISDEIEKITSYPATDFIEHAVRSFLSIIHDEDQERAVDVVTKSVESKESFAIEYRFVTADGNIRWVFEKGQCVVNEHGKATYIDGVILDITERKQTEVALQESEKRYRTLFEDTLNPILVANDKEEYIDANNAALCFMETSRDQLLGKSVWEYTPDDMLEKQKQEHALFLKPRTLDTEYQINGKLKTLLLNIVPVETRQGTILYGIGQDITERKQSEEKLKEAEFSHRTVADFTYDWETWQNPDGTFRYISPSCERITGYPAKQFIDDAALFKTIIFSEDREIWDKHRHDVIELPGAKEIQFRIRRQDGKTVWIEHVCRQIVDEQGVFMGYRASNRDITERKQAEQQRELNARILDVINQSVEWKDSIEEILNDIKEFTGLEAVALRLKEGEDFPYYVTKGFPGYFVEAERYLCTRDAKGEMVRDSDGNPYVECMCGNILCERTDPVKNFFTKGGSFWSNNTSKLLAETTDKDRQTRTRNRCNSEGYESVALIPLKAGSEILGLIQLNDKRTNRFNENLIRFFEKIGKDTGVAFARKRAEEALQSRTHELDLLNSAGRAFVSSLNPDQVFTTVLDQVRRIIGIVTCSIWITDPKSGGLVCREATPPKDDIVRGWQLEMGQGLAGWAVQHGKILNIPDTRTEKRHFKGVDQRTGLQLRSVLSVPLKIQNEVFGALQLLDEAENRFGKSDERLAESLAVLAAIAIKNARLHRQTQKDAETKTVLLQEVNHRVKNNLAAITGMLYIEQRHAAKSPGKRTDAAILSDMANRIKGLSIVHDMLSGSNWAPQSLSKLVEKLICSALQALPLDIQVQVNLSAAVPVVVSPKEAHHLAIVINELSTNVVKYVAPVKETTQITVRINSEPDEKTVLIEFRDNGPGFPDMVLNSGGRNVGMYLLENTVRHSLRGKITFHNDNGAVVTVQFVKKTE